MDWLGFYAESLLTQYEKRAKMVKNDIWAKVTKKVDQNKA